MLVAMGLTALVVFYFYAFVFEPQAPPEAAPPEPVAAAEADPTQAPPAFVGDDDDSAGTALAAVPVAPVLPAAPDRTLEFGWSGVGAKWSSLGGGPASYVLDDYVAQAETAPWLPTWVLSKIKGDSEGPFTLACAKPEVHGQVDVIRHAGIAHLPVGIDGQGIAADAGNYRVVSNSVDSVVFATVRNGIKITKSYSFPREGYVTDFRVSLKNVGGDARDVTPAFGVVDFMPEPESRYGPKVETHVQVEDDHETADESKVRKKTGELTWSGPMSWWGIGDKYFLLGLEPIEPIQGTANFTLVDADTGLFASTVATATQTLQPGQTAEFAFKLWAGPKTLEGLESAEMRMASSVDFGMFGLIAIPILYFLKFLYGLIGSYGLAIIVLTITVKLLLFPLTQKQYKSMKAMQDLNPEIAEMREKYGDDREALNKEMMALFQARGVNPMGGCLPMVVQMPIWFALYRVLWMSADLYQAEFLYFCDLTLQDPLGLFPVLMSLTMYITQKMNESPTMDQSQQKIMRFMTLFFGVIMFTLPSGLVMYIFVNNILSIIQQWWIKRGFGETVPAESKA